VTASFFAAATPPAFPKPFQLATQDLTQLYATHSSQSFSLARCSQKGSHSVQTEDSQMLKITKIGSRDSTQTIKLDGKLLEPWVAEVLNVCAQESAQPGRNLDLSGLTFVDQAGAELLRDLIRRGITISACSGFVAELLHLENP
jgi:hypothetical protein